MISERKYKEAQGFLEEINGKPAIQEDRYNKAMEYISEKDYGSAYLFLNGLDYEDSEEKKDEIKEPAQQEILERAENGSIVYFGEYEQDNDTSNGKETIEWIVLKKKEGRMLVISRYALDNKRFDSYVLGSWKDSFIRKWLNQEFISNVFSTKERKWIHGAHLSGECSNHTTSTKDKIFFLSVDEAEEYFSDESELQCIATAYAVSNGAYVDSAGMCNWWLRTCGKSPVDDTDYWSGYAAIVDKSGFVYEEGFDMDHFETIRPALWINLD